MKEYSDLLQSLNEKELNALQDILLQKAQEIFRKEKLSDYFTWTKAVWLTARGLPLDFANRKYLVGIYQDQYPDIRYLKASQMGLSERLISEAIWIADQLRMNTLYTFPTQVHLQDFVQARLNPVLMNSDYLRSRTESKEEKKVEKLGLKRIGGGYIYFRGSQNAKQIITVDADCVILDERDRFDENNVPFIEKRLLASKLKWRREASTPTQPNMGIHKSYLETDQRIWEVPCQHCKEWQEIDFFKNIDLKEHVVRCAFCRKIIDRFADGRWTITNPKNKIHGYKINGLYNPTITIEELAKKYQDASVAGFSALQQFYNQDLGIPYEVSGLTLTSSELDTCKREYDFPIPDVAEAFLGVDTGVHHHHSVVLQRVSDNLMRLVWAGTVDQFKGPYDSIEALIRKYNVKIAVIDKRPEQTRVKELMDMFPGKVYAVEYPPNAKFSVQEYYSWDDIKYELRLDRTISLDYLVSDIQNQRVELPRNIEVIEGFYDQLKASVRWTDDNKKTQWVEKSADHYFHALNYARMAQTRGNSGKALLEYYKTPSTGLTPSLIDWIRVQGKRIF